MFAALFIYYYYYYYYYISEVFGRNGMIQRSIIRPELIGLLTKIIGVPTIGLPAVIPLRFSMIMSYFDRIEVYYHVKI